MRNTWRFGSLAVAMTFGASAWAGYGSDLPSINEHLARELADAKEELGKAREQTDPVRIAETHKNATQTLVAADKLVGNEAKRARGSSKDKAKLKSLASEIKTLKEKAVAELFPLWEAKIDGITAQNKGSWTETFLGDLMRVVPATDKRLAALAKKKGCEIDVKANVPNCP